MRYYLRPTSAADHSLDDVKSSLFVELESPPIKGSFIHLVDEGVLVKIDEVIFLARPRQRFHDSEVRSGVLTVTGQQTPIEGYL